MPGYCQDSDLTGMTTQYMSALGTQGLDWTQFTSDQRADLIARASDDIDSYCRQTFALTNVTDQTIGRGTRRLRLYKWPLAQRQPVGYDPYTTGFVSNSLAVDTTLVSSITAGATSVVLANPNNLLVGQLLVIADANQQLAESGLRIDAISIAGEQATLTLHDPTTYAHASGTRAVVNTIDAIQIMLPGWTSIPFFSSSLIVDANKGFMTIYGPLTFQAGYYSGIPRDVPILVTYTYGYLTPDGASWPAYPRALREVCMELCLRKAQRYAMQHGVKSWTLEGSSVSYDGPPSNALDLDLADMLAPFVRGQGFG